MGFDPSTIKRPVPSAASLPPNASREQRIAMLAQELHRRGVTVSLADAKRLAEGMVDVERKVIDEGSRKRDEPRPQDTTRASIQNSDPMFAAAGVSQAPPQRASSSPVPTLSLAPDFARFVERTSGTPLARAQAAPVPAPTPAAVAVSRAPEPIAASMPSPRAAPAVYGRNDEFKTASVPHASARKQMFFDEAPPMSQLRGFQQSGVPEALKFRGFHGTESALHSAPVSPVAPSVVAPAAESASTIAAHSPMSVPDVVREEVVEEQFVREEMSMSEPEPMMEEAVPETAFAPAPAYVSEPAYAPEPAVEEPIVERPVVHEFERPSTPEPVAHAPEHHVEQPVASHVTPPVVHPEPVSEPIPEPVPVVEEKPKEDLAKQHGVDIFQMFKKK